MPAERWSNGCATLPFDGVGSTGTDQEFVLVVVGFMLAMQGYESQEAFSHKTKTSICSVY